LYAFSASTGVVSDTGTSCSYNAANSRHECTLTGVAAGTAAITFRNSTAATGIASKAIGNGRRRATLPKSGHKRLENRGLVVGDIMHKYNVSLGEASKIVKQQGLY
jgi:hypothetical protein